MIAPIILAITLLVPNVAEAARCPKGKILYRSAGVCITPQQAARQGIKVKRFSGAKFGRGLTARAEGRQRYRRASAVDPGRNSTGRVAVVGGRSTSLQQELDVWLTPERRRLWVDMLNKQIDWVAK